MKHISLIIGGLIILTSCTQGGTPTPPTSTGSGTGAVVQSGTTASGIAEQKPIQRTLAMEGNNVVLMEDDKKIETLTTLGNAPLSKLYKSDYTCEVWEIEQKRKWTNYLILQSSGSLGIIVRLQQICGEGEQDGGAPGATHHTVFFIPLNKNIRSLTAVPNMDMLEFVDVAGIKTRDTSKYPDMPTTRSITLSGNIIKYIMFDEYLRAEDDYCPVRVGCETANYIKKDGYTKQGAEWVKAIDVSKIPIQEDAVSISPSNEKGPIQKDVLRDYTVQSAKAYFHDEAKNPRKAYVMKWQTVKVGEIRDGFAYAEYTNESGTKTTGYIKTSDIIEGIKEPPKAVSPSGAGTPKIADYRISSKQGNFSDATTIRISSIQGGNIKLTASRCMKYDGDDGCRTKNGVGVGEKSGDSWKVAIVEEADTECSVSIRFTDTSLVVSGKNPMSSCESVPYGTYTIKR